MTQPEEVTMAHLRFLVDVCEDSSASEKLRNLRLAAGREVFPYVQQLYEGFIRTDVILAIVKGKFGFLRKARSVAEVRKILSPPKVHFNGREVVPDDPTYHIPAEEMLIWSETSFIAPLSEYGYKRYMKLVREFFGEEVYKKIMGER